MNPFRDPPKAHDRDFRTPLVIGGDTHTQTTVRGERFVFVRPEAGFLLEATSECRHDVTMSWVSVAHVIPVLTNKRSELL